MAIIPQYNNPTETQTLRPQRSGYEALQQSARAQRGYGEENRAVIEQGAAQTAQGIKDLGTSFKDAQQAQTLKEKSNLAVAGKTLELQNFQRLSDIEKLPPEQRQAALHKLSEDNSAQQDEFMQGATTPESQAYAADIWSSVNLNTQEHSLEAGSNAAAESVKNQLQNFIGLSNASIQTMPTQANLDNQKQQLADHVEELIKSTPGMGGKGADAVREWAAQMRGQYSSTYVDAIGATHPELVPGAIAKNAADLGPKEQERLTEKGVAQTRSQLYDQKAQMDLQRMESLNKTRDLMAGLDGLVKTTTDADGQIIHTYPPGTGNFLALAEKEGADPQLIRAYRKTWESDVANNIKVGGIETFDSMYQRAVKYSPGDPKFPTPLEVAGASNMTMSQRKQITKMITPATALTPSQSQAEKGVFASIDHTMQAQATTNPDYNKTADQQSIVFGAGLEARAYYIDKVAQGLRDGDTIEDLSNPRGPKYVFKDKPILSFLTDSAASNVQQAQPGNQQQAVISRMTNSATTVFNWLDHNSPEQVQHLIDASTDPMIRGINVTKAGSAWCADFVNQWLGKMGITGTGSGLASSFEHWGFPVDAARTQPNDVFYVPAPGFTGHVGVVVSTPEMRHGVMEVQVISTHLAGATSNGGGREWRPVEGMDIRRATASLDHIAHYTAAPAAQSGGGLLERLYKFERDHQSGQPDE